MYKTLIVDSSGHKTELCGIAEKYRADKGPFSMNSVNCGHRKGYTAVYEMLMGTYRKKPINFLEFGIFAGDSIRMFQDYFEDMEYYGLDFNPQYIQNCKDLNLPRTHYGEVNVKDGQSICDAFVKFDTMYDIILDDSSHEVPDQGNIIQIASHWLKPGGLLIIEDLERQWPEQIYDGIRPFIDANFSFESFIVCHHNNRYCPDNDKLWVGIKK